LRPLVKVEYRNNETGACDIAIIKDNEFILSYIHVSPRGLVDTNEVFEPPRDVTKYKDINQFFDDIRHELHDIPLSRRNLFEWDR